jgi:hypothetical protein
MKTQTYKIILRLHKFTQFVEAYSDIKFEEAYSDIEQST